MDNWNKFQREDLNSIPQMEDMGFAVVFHENDKRNGRISPQNYPHNAVSFKRETDGLVIWMIIRGTKIAWQTAFLKNGSYCDHQWFEAITEAAQRK